MGRKGEKLGYKSESNVSKALYHLLKAREIDNFWRTKRYSPEDLAGIDFFVRYRGLTIPLQVKSSEFRKNEFDDWRGGYINCVIGQGDNLIPRIKQAIRDYRFRILEATNGY